MDVFRLRERVVDDYRDYITSFIAIQDGRIQAEVDENLDAGLLWPEPRIGLNPSFETGGLIDEHVESGLLHSECSRIFRIKREDGAQSPMRLHRHQLDAIRAAQTGDNYVLTTGTGSGKSLSYIIPIVDRVLRSGSGKGIRAIVVYPMNALANSQEEELKKFLQLGYGPGAEPVRFRRYTGQENDEERQEIIANPPDILLTNYVMLELILTRVGEAPLVQQAKGLEFLVFDELHTYRGRQGADVALLARRVREACEADKLQLIGTSATMSSGGTFRDQQIEIAKVASLLFGSNVKPERVIGETLRRATQMFDTTDSSRIASLRERMLSPHEPGKVVPREEFVADPLSAWIESVFGIREEAESGRLVRVAPRTIRGDEGAAAELARLIGVPVELCAEQIENQLMVGSTVSQENGVFPIFAFRLHQFLSRGDTVYASLENENDRYLTVHAQQFVPSDRSRVLMPLVFCRECGQEYYSVVRRSDDQLEGRPFGVPVETDGTDGYLYVSEKRPWPSKLEEIVQQVPESWVEEGAGGQLKVKRDQKKHLPVATRVSARGVLESGDTTAWFVPAPFKFCLACGVSYPARQRSDLGKLANLGSGGRSTATTVLSAAAVRTLLADPTIDPQYKKLLAFSDNRQDASLQAGHFNDFIEVGLLRSALYRSVELAGSAGLTHEVLSQKVFEVLFLPKALYVANPEIRGVNAMEADKTFRDVLGYRLYIDQKRGWRITSPNLEQTGLLSIDYASLDDLIVDEDVWSGLHGALSSASPSERRAVCKTLLDFLRRELAIKVDYLDELKQEQIVQASNQWLTGNWALDDDEKLAHAYVCFPRGRNRDNDTRDAVYVSGRGGFGQYIGRRSTFPQWTHGLSLDDKDDVITGLMKALATYGLLAEVVEARGELPPGYQVQAAAMRWVQGTGSVGVDPIKVPRPPEDGLRPNRFFTNFYKSVAANGQGLEAREHTAQVPIDERLDREGRFRKGTLPVLYCSPTMELGVDIAGLLVVGLRNVPPTPANYAQRSGRAGRQGQPALVFTYCTSGSPHDQYFFRRQERMVAGIVSPPRLDVANEDLVRAHVHAIWLSEIGLSLGSSLTDVLNVEGDEPTLALLERVAADVDNTDPLNRAKQRAKAVLADVLPQLQATSWWSDQWLDESMRTIPRRFRAATERWVTLYRSALEQMKVQNKIIADAARQRDHNEARRLRREAEAKLELLRSESARKFQSDFYSYRYFASEGFLPGYSFPRLPLSAFIPARRGAKGTDEFLSRPRFLAITEFGPRNFIYHEGSRYQIHKVEIPVPEAGSDSDDRILVRSAKVCSACGYLHPLDRGQNIDLCESCGHNMGPAMHDLFRLQNVSTKRRDRINSDEEERQRQGFDILSGIRFASRGPIKASASKNGEEVASLRYGNAASIWRINLGWKRRKASEALGFTLDIERGYWAAKQDSTDDDAEGDPMSARQKRVIPYVDDTRNAIVLTPAGLPADDEQRNVIMASLQAALKTAIQVTYQLEDTELAVESLPSPGDRRVLLLYESAEGGAGVLRRLVEDAGALAQVARNALEICHFNPDTGADLRMAPGAKEVCEAGCYDCLLSYYNQPDHRFVDRQAILELLLEWAGTTVVASPGDVDRKVQMQRLSNQAASELECKFLRFLDSRAHKLPSRAQVQMPEQRTRPDFVYDDEFVVVYVDGPPHDFPERQKRDETQTQALHDAGWSVLRFHHYDDWATVVATRPDVFGEGV
jgi:ATP-dependent helicase YprA (DUF1998 family)